MGRRAWRPAAVVWPLVMVPLAALLGCGQTANGADPPPGTGVIRARYTETLAAEGAAYRQEIEVIADGDRRTRVTVLGGDPPARPIGTYTVWDGQALLEVVPGGGDPPYNRLSTPEELQGVQPPTYVFKPGTEGFGRGCGDPRHLGTQTLLGRTADRYACAPTDFAPSLMEPHEMSIDQATGLLLKDATAELTIEATVVEFGADVVADVFSTDPPRAEDLPRSKLEFRVPRVGGGELVRANHQEPLIVVVGDAEGIRATVQRLLPLTADGHKPQVLGMLVALPSPDWQGSLLNPEDAQSLADTVSKAVGSFAVPVGIDFKGAVSEPITSAAGIEPGTAGSTVIGFVTADGTVAHAATAAVTDADLREQIEALG
jgi:hypothetical protein